MLESTTSPISGLQMPTLKPEIEIQHANLPQSTGSKLIEKISPDHSEYGFNLSKEFPPQHLVIPCPFQFRFSD